MHHSYLQIEYASACRGTRMSSICIQTLLQARIRMPVPLCLGVNLAFCEEANLVMRLLGTRVLARVVVQGAARRWRICCRSCRRCARRSRASVTASPCATPPASSSWHPPPSSAPRYTPPPIPRCAVSTHSLDMRSRRKLEGLGILVPDANSPALRSPALC